MKDFDFPAFKKELKEKTIESFVEYKQKNGIDDLCGFAFYTDDSFMTLAVFIDTRSKLEGDEDEIEFHRFTVDEWEEGDYPNKKLHLLNKLLEEANDPDDLFYDIEYISGLCNCFVEVIAEMKEGNYFEGVSDDFIWNVGISGYDNPPLSIDIFRNLNTPELTEKFEKFLIKEYKTYPSDEWSYKKGKWVSRY